MARRIELSITEARQLVEQNSRFADLTTIREDILFDTDFNTIVGNEGYTPGQALPLLITANRARHLSAFTPFFNDMFANTEAGRNLTNELRTAANLGLTPADLRDQDLLETCDPRFNNPDDITDFVFDAVLQDRDNRRAWLEAVDERVSTVSDAKLQEIDEAAEQGERVTEDLVIVGASLSASLYASIFGPFRKITVITQEEAIGEPWRSRPFHINSSVEETPADLDRPRLPLLQTTTTPLAVSGQLNRVEGVKVLDSSALRVTCEDDTDRKYLSGPKLGAAIATNIICDADDFLVEQRVDIPATRVNPNGTKTLTIVGKDGKTRELDAKTVLFLTGPGEEECLIDDEQTKRLYEKARKDVDALIANVKGQVKAGGRVTIPALPRILPLTSVQKLYGLWYRTLNEDPDLFPLAEAIKPGLRWAIPGGGDSGLVIAELGGVDGPGECYPQDLEKADAPTRVIYGTPFTGPDDYMGRKRYERVFENSQGKVQGRREKVTGIRNVVDQSSRKVTGVRVLTANNRRGEVSDFVFPATGLVEKPIDQQLQFPIERVLDADGNVVGLGNEGVYVGGAACCFTAADFPPEARTIINGLAIRENTKSQWVNGVLGERLSWTIVNNEPLNQEKILGLLRGDQQQLKKGYLTY